jgi:hypothetical protein
MPPIHLNKYKRKILSYSEHERRFCLHRESGTHLRAYDIDVTGADRQYFKDVHVGEKSQGRRSADGIYVGSFHIPGRQIYFVIVIELEGHTSFEVSAEQVRSTLDHFYHQSHNITLDDDGARHHEQARLKPRPYISKKNHLVVGIVIGSTGRRGELKKYKEWPIVCLNSRQPVQDKTPFELFEEIASYTGQLFW